MATSTLSPSLALPHNFIFAFCCITMLSEKIDGKEISADTGVYKPRTTKNIIIWILMTLCTKRAN
jgi:hypothetical protein